MAENELQLANYTKDNKNSLGKLCSKEQREGEYNTALWDMNGEWKIQRLLCFTTYFTSGVQYEFH